MTRMQWKAMTDAEKNDKIATIVNPAHDFTTGVRKRPDYIHDLNAIQEAWLDQSLIIRDMLCKYLVEKICHNSDHNAIEATAKQKAEAFAMVLENIK
jgi:hypothetical protein